MISPVGVVLLHYIDKGVDRERIMLARHAEPRIAPPARAEVLLHDVGLLEQHPGEREQLLALARDGNALVRAHEGGHAHFLLQIVDSSTQARLRDKKPFGRVGDAAAFGYGDKIGKLL